MKQSRCPRLLRPAHGVLAAAQEAKPVFFDEVYLVAFILHPSITALFEQLLDTIKRKELNVFQVPCLLAGTGST